MRHRISDMTYAETIKFLYELCWFGAKLGLENTFKLAALAGNPQSQLRFIHVAGSNGKGSTCAMLESIYRAAGLRVGLFTSPHLVSFRERIQVNRRLISEAEVVRLVRKMQPWLAIFSAEHHPTFFEVVTVMALEHFAEQNCDLVIWETGLGGRLDATNIVTPLAGVITNISLEHQQWLGNSLAQIAAEKAGIIKPGVPVLTAANDLEAVAVIERTARERSAPLFKAVKSPCLAGAGETPVLPLLGEHQQLNAALAVAAVDVLQKQIPVSDSAIRAGLSTVHWPGRLQLVTRPNGQEFLLDVAHNPAGMEILATALGRHFSFRKPALVLGILRDKDWPSMCAHLAPLASRIVTVPVSSERSATADELATACSVANPLAKIFGCASFGEAMNKIGGDPFLVITGSQYLVGEALEWLGLCPEVGAGERALNEWGRAKHDARPVSA